MEEELVVNSIQSVYNKRPNILFKIKRNSRKINTNYIPKISNILDEYKNTNDISPEINMPTKKKINELYNLKSLPNKKNKFKNRYSFNNYKVNYSLEKHINENKKAPFINKTETEKIYDLKEKKQDLIKKNKNVYLLRKLYIILPNDKTKSNKEYEQYKQLFIYYPTDIKSKRVIDYIESAKKNDIICNNIKDIFLEIYKYLKLYKADNYKLEIYDEKFHPIKLGSQLFINKIRIIYVNISYINDRQFKASKKGLISRPYMSNIIYLNKKVPEKIKLNNIFNDASTEKEESKIKINTITNVNSISNELYNSTKYNTINQVTDGKNTIDDLKSDLYQNRNHQLILSYDKRNSSVNKKNNKTLETSFSQNLDKKSNLFNDLKNNDKINSKKNAFSIHKYKIKKNFFTEIINKKGIEKNHLVSPFLFNFDVTDIINNEYALKYLINKNKVKKEDEIFKIRNKFEIKTLNIEESNSKRDKNKNDIIPNIKANFSDKNKNNYIQVSSLIEKNKKLLYELNLKINEFINNDIDALMSNEEIEDFKLLSCNYVLINELKDFPLLKIKKKFAFLVYLSQKISSKYKDIFIEMNSSQDFLDNILKMADFENALNYLNSIYNNIIKRKNYILGYLRAANIDLKISFNFFLLFIFYNKNLIDKNPNNKLFFISFECIDIKTNSEINFQQYCDYYLVLTRNDYLNYNKKYNFIKDLILRIFMSENFNTRRSIKQLKDLDNDININKIMNILNLDMVSVKLEENHETYDNINKIYNGYLDMMEH